MTHDIPAMRAYGLPVILIKYTTGKIIRRLLYIVYTSCALMCFAKTFESAAAGVTTHTISKLFSWMKLVYVCVCDKIYKRVRNNRVKYKD